MEIAIFLALLALGALAALVIQTRPVGRRHYREDTEWEINAFVSEGDDLPPGLPMARGQRHPPKKAITLVGAKALTAGMAKGSFWLALREDQPQ